MKKNEQKKNNSFEKKNLKCNLKKKWTVSEKSAMKKRYFFPEKQKKKILLS